MPLFRFARPAPTPWVCLKSLFATTLIWIVVAAGIPLGMVRWQQDAGLHHLFITTSRPVGAFLGVLGLVVGVWCAALLAFEGKGTPLPFDAPRRLVTSGPYAWLRNPMMTALVISTIGAGVASGSLLVDGYALLLALGWQVMLASAGDRDLERAFGREYEAWRRSVRLWLPMRRPFAGADALPPVWFANRRRDGGAWE
jgi:protein-S-isoprenylcysteine O-methyltransferase Ste14